jgi:uncharacterized membrane protein YdjX (TVP38/TMEM64 family)
VTSPLSRLRQHSWFTVKMPARSATARLGLLIVLVAALAGTVAVVGAPDPGRLAATIAGFGSLGPVIVIGGSALLLAALVPRSVLAAGAGLVFGPLLGSVYVLAGAALAALAAFAAGRVLGRDFVTARARLAALDARLTARSVLSVALMRILPIAPFGLVSYGLGTTSVPVGSYLLGTAIGAAPSSPGFVASLAAAALLVIGSATATAILRRRAARHSATS